VALYRHQGKQRSKVLPDVRTLSEAKKARRNLLTDLEAKRSAPASKVTVSEAAERWLDGRRGRVRERTLEADERGIDYLKRYFGTRRLQDVGPEDIAAYLAALREGKVGSGKKLSEWTCVGALKTARAVFDAAVLHGSLAVNPTTRLQKHVRPRQMNARQPLVLSAEQVDKLVAAAVEKAPAYAPIIAALAFTGGRVREILGLKWADVDHDAKLIHLNHQVTVAGRSTTGLKTPESERYNAITPKLEPFLGREARMAARWSAPDDFCFSAARGKPREYRNLRRALGSASAAAGLSIVRAHDLRHSFTSNLIPHTDLVTVSRAVGHKNIAVTAKVYAHALGTPQEQAARAAKAAAAAGLGY
jgi:integrase